MNSPEFDRDYDNAYDQSLVDAKVMFPFPEYVRRAHDAAIEYARRQESTRLAALRARQARMNS